MRLIILYIFLISTFGVLAEDYFFDPGDEVSISFSSTFQEGDKVVVEVDNFTMFLPETVDLDRNYFLPAENFGQFSSTVSNDYSGITRLNGLALFGNSDTCEVKVFRIRGLDSANIFTFRILNNDTLPENNFERFSYIENIYPVPTSSGLPINIETISDMEDIYDIQVVDMAGKLIYLFKDITILEGQNIFQITMPVGTPNGRFRVIATGRNQILTGQIVVVN